jgi:hypothetical protein
MAFEFLKELLEMQQPAPAQAQQQAAAPANTHPLTANPGFNALAKVVPNFAQKLMDAWNGDARDYQRTHGQKGEMLFPLMLKNIAKYVPKLPMTPQVQQLITTLTQMHAKQFAAQRNVDTSVWQHEPWAKESLESDLDRYTQLREEFEELTRE